MQKERATYREIKRSAFAEVLRLDFIEPDYNQKISLPEAVSQLGNTIAKHINSSEHIRKYIEGLKKGMGQECPNSPVNEIIKYLADQNGQIDKSDADINLRFIDSLMFPIFDFEREKFARLFYSNIDATNSESSLLMYSEEIGELVDELYYSWFKMIVAPYQNLKPEKRIEYKKELSSQLAHFDYTVFDYIDGNIYNRRTWAKAFPTLVNELVLVLRETAHFLKRTEGCFELSEYLFALADAYACQEIKKLEDLWAKVDEVWIKIPITCRMFPIHGMENGYEHPFGVSPEYKLVVRTEYGEKLISGIRNQTPVYAQKLGIENSLVEIAKKKLTNLDMGVFTTAMRSGVCANFRSAGQVVPNRQAILANGGKVFMDIDTAQNSVHRDMNLLIQNCTPEMGDKLSRLIKVDGSLSHTIGHECNHPVGCTTESDEALGETKGRLEEAKATIGGLGVILRNKSLEEYPEVIALCVARVCRFFKKETFGNPTLQPYVRENLVMANLLIYSKIVNLKNSDETALEIDLSEDNLQKFNFLLQDFYSHLIANYHSKDPVSDILKMESIYCRESQVISDWMNLVNRK